MTQPQYLIGKEVADFKADAYHEDAFTTVKKADLMGQWSLFFFYPGDFTFVCPTELKDLGNHYDQFIEIDCEVYSVSTDSHFVHKAWHDASDTIKGVKYPMIADPTGAISKDFGVYVEDAGQALRGAFIINPKGEIAAYEINNIDIGRNVSEILRKVQAAQFAEEHVGEVCPANWTPGAETLEPGIDLVGKL